MTGKLDTYTTVSPAATDLIGLSRPPFTTGTYFNTTFDLLKDFVVGGGSLSTVYVASNGGVDSPGMGTQSQPYLTIEYAFTQITTASAGNPFLVLCEGHFVESALNLKPYIGINGQGISSLIVSGAITLDASWSATGGILILENFQNFQTLSTTDLDFSSFPAAFIKFSNLIFDTNDVIRITGGSASNTNIILEGLNYFGSISNFTITNSSNLYVKNSNLNGITVKVDEDFTLGTYCQVDSVYANTFSIIVDSDATSEIYCYINACSFSEFAISSSDATAQAYLTNTYCPTIDIFGTSSRLNADKLENNPNLSSGATFFTNIDILENYTINMGGNLIKRKIVLYNGPLNNHQFLGFGALSDELVAQVDSTSAKFSFYAATSTSTSDKVAEINGDGTALIGVGTKDAAAALQVISTTGGISFPQLTTAERTALGSPSVNVAVKDTDLNQLMWWNGTAWVILG